jgi:hypothetical protein
MGPWTGAEAENKRQLFFPCRESNCKSSVAHRIPTQLCRWLLMCKWNVILFRKCSIKKTISFITRVDSISRLKRLCSPLPWQLWEISQDSKLEFNIEEWGNFASVSAEVAFTRDLISDYKKNCPQGNCKHSILRGITNLLHGREKYI